MNWYAANSFFGGASSCGIGIIVGAMMFGGHPPWWFVGWVVFCIIGWLATID